MDGGSPVLYKQVKVGSVQSYQFSRTKKQLVIGVHIEKEYENLVNASTRFWNASGIPDRWLDRRKRGMRFCSGALASGVSKAIPPAIRLCSDSLLTWIPPVKPPVRVIPLAFQKRVEALTRFSYSFSICTPITSCFFVREN